MGSVVQLESGNTSDEVLVLAIITPIELKKLTMFETALVTKNIFQCKILKEKKYC